MKKLMLLFFAIGFLLYACKKNLNPAKENAKFNQSDMSNLRTATVSVDRTYYAYTYAGTAGTAGHSNGSGRLSATFNVPSGVAFDSSGNMFVTDRENNCIREITPAGTVSVYAGSTSGVAGYTNGIGTAARFNAPMKLAIDGSDNIYVADRDNNAIRKITHTTKAVTTLAGSNTGAAGLVNGTGSAALFDFPVAVAVTSTGTVYVADAHNERIRKITSAGVVTTFAGSGPAGTGAWADGTKYVTRFSDPSGVAIDAAGNIIVADRGNNCIRKVTTGSVTSTIAGRHGTAGLVDGPALKGEFNEPYDVIVAPEGAIFVSELGNNCIRRINTAGELLTVGGTGSAGIVNGNYCSFHNPTGIGMDAAGNIYVADVTNEVIRQLVPVTRRLQSCLGWVAKEVSPGLTWFRFNNKHSFYLRYSDSIGPQNINVIDIDLNLCKLVIAHRADNNGTNLTGLAAGVAGAIAAINGAYYEHHSIPYSGPGPYTEEHDSFLKNEGSIIWHVGTLPTGHYAGLWWKHAGAFYWDNTASTAGLAIDSAHTSMDPYASLSYPNILSGGPILINNYVLTGASNYDNKPSTNPGWAAGKYMYPRSTMAFTENSHIIFMTVDAIETHKYVPYYGMSTGDLAQFLKTYFNPQYALNIDGGGSTTMWIKNENQGNAANQGVVNESSGANPLTATNNYDRQRVTLLNAIVVVPK